MSKENQTEPAAAEKPKKPAPRGVNIRWADFPEDENITQRLAKHKERLNRATPGANFDDRAAIRNLIIEGMQAAEARGDLTQLPGLEDMEGAE